MNKLPILSIIIVLSLCLCGCGSSSKYNNATTALSSGDVNTAITLFEELARKNYQDSAEQLKEAKYQFVKNNLDRDNTRAMTYLDSLKSDQYKDSEQIYQDVYSWKADIAISRTERSSVHNDVLDVTNRMFPIYFFNFRTYGGPKDGGEFTGTYEVIFSNGEKTSNNFIGRDSDIFYAISLSAKQNPIGKTTFNLYDGTGNLIATKSCTIR